MFEGKGSARRPPLLPSVLFSQLTDRFVITRCSFLLRGAHTCPPARSEALWTAAQQKRPGLCFRLGERRQEGLLVKPARQMSHPGRRVQGRGGGGVHSPILDVRIMPSILRTIHLYKGKSQAHHSVAVGPWRRYLASQNLHLLIYKLGRLTPTSTGFGSLKRQLYVAISTALPLGKRPVTVRSSLSPPKRSPNKNHIHHVLKETVCDLSVGRRGPGATKGSLSHLLHSQGPRPPHRGAVLGIC